MPLRSVLQPNKQQRTGYEVSFGLLIKSLKRVGMNLYIDDYRLARKNPTYPISISGFPDILNNWPLPNPAVLGPGLYEHPKRNPELMRDPRFRGYIVKSEWMKEMFGPYYGRDRITPFFSGMDLTEWPDERNHEKEFDFLIYDKVRWNRDHYVPNLIEPILKTLQSKGLSFSVLRYGTYRHEQYAALLAKSKAMLFLCEHETQGMAWQEALASNIPVLAWDQGFWLDPNRADWELDPVPATSVPMFAEECGERFTHFGDFEASLDRFMANLERYEPRRWVSSELSLERSAAIFLKAYREVAM